MQTAIVKTSYTEIVFNKSVSEPAKIYMTVRGRYNIDNPTWEIDADVFAEAIRKLGFVKGGAE